MTVIFTSSAGGVLVCCVMGATGVARAWWREVGPSCLWMHLGHLQGLSVIEGGKPLGTGGAVIMACKAGLKLGYCQCPPCPFRLLSPTWVPSVLPPA